MSSSTSAFHSTSNRIIYPETPRIPVIEDYHGTQIIDNYRYLEDPDSSSTVEWVAKQNFITSRYLNSCPDRNQLKERLEQIYNYERYSCPFKRGNRYFFFKNDGLQNQSVLYKQDSLETKEVSVLLDPNLLTTDGTAALGSYAFSECGEYLAYGVSYSGSDWQTVSILTVQNKKLLTEILHWVKFSKIAWTHDSKGFFYSRYPKPNDLDSDDSEHKKGSETQGLLNHTLYYHRLGTDQNEDCVVYATPENPKWMLSADVSVDGEYLLISLNDSCEPVNRLFYKKLNGNKGYDNPNNNEQKDSGIVKLIDNFDHEYSYITNVNTKFWFKTNRDAPRYKVISIDFSNPAIENWKDIITHHSVDVLSYVEPVNETQLIVCYMHDVKEILQLYDLDGKLNQAEFPLPDLGSIAGLAARKQDSIFFYQFQSFLYPGTIYMVDLVSGQTKVFRETTIQGFNSSDYCTKQVKYASKDGTLIPMFIIHNKNLKLDGNNPTLLYGYGGFNISLTPSFSVSRIVFMQNLGGIYCVPNIRGGGEYGEEWHKAGQIHNKQNVFDDFIAAAEYLIQNQYTQPSKLAIHGGSNGGLLVCAVVNQRPELFGCVVGAVGVLDMLRFHKFTIGYAWTSDYGCADNPDEFATLIKYSPVHNINPNITYPALLLTTADHDDRVSPLHSYKYISNLQYLVGKNEKQIAPLLIRIEVKAGHGASTPLSKRIAETADVYAFMAKTLNITCKW